MAYIGVDLHTNSFTVCRLSDDGSESFETFQLCVADLERFCLSLDADDQIAVEATGNSAYFRNEVVSCVGRVVVVNPGQFQVIRKSVSKTDKNDARALAFFLSKDMLPETRLNHHRRWVIIKTEEPEFAQERGDFWLRINPNCFSLHHPYTGSAGQATDPIAQQDQFFI